MDASALYDANDDVVESVLPDRPVTSVRDVEALYGRLYALGRGFTGEYDPFLSPDDAASLVGNDRLLVTRVDVTDQGLEIGDEPVVKSVYASETGTPTPDGLYPDVAHVAHAKYESARGVDHSITHLAGQTTGPDKHADHAAERFTRWPSEDAVREEAVDHEDGWLLDALDELGADEDAMERVRAAARERSSEEQYLHTVAFRFGGDDLTTTDRFEPDAEWHLPGEIEVLQEAMVRRKTRKFRAKNEADDASGDGRGYVDDGVEEVYGVVDDPMKWYLSKQMEKFPRLDPDEAWRTQGLGRGAAIAAQNGTTFLDGCGEPGPGVTAFYLPYFETGVSADSIANLYHTLVEQADEATDDNAVARLYQRMQQAEGATAADLRFVFMTVSKYQKDRWRLLAFEPNATVYHPRELAVAHHDVVTGPDFGEGGVFSRNDFELLKARDAASSWLGIVTSVGYFGRTCSTPGDDDEPSSDDLRFRATAGVVSGRGVDPAELRSAYVDRIAEATDPGEGFFPTTLVASQYAQLAALDRADLLDADATTDVITPSMTQQTDAGSGGRSRTERLDDFIDRHDALDGERLGVFALGALVGRISRYQRAKNRSMTAVKRHPIDKLTRHNVTDVATDVVGSNVVYSGEEGYTGTMYAELMAEVVEELVDLDPADVSLSTDDLRFAYAMGIAYGLNDRSTSEYDDE
jgi:hypothetical protein